jgi:hypothetical protein
MIPNMDERIDSIVRALSVVVLPSLPPEASLAKEQLQLSVKHLEIMRAQLDGMLSFEAEELRDVVVLSEELAAASPVLLVALADGLDQARRAVSPPDIREARRALHAAIALLITRPPVGIGPADEKTVSQIVLRAEQQRVAKDRRWFQPFGFDINPQD